MSIPDVLTYVYIFVDLVRRGVLTLVGEIRRYRNDLLLTRLKGRPSRDFETVIKIGKNAF